MTKKGKKKKWTKVPLDELGLGERVTTDWKPIDIIPGEVYDPTSYDFLDEKAESGPYGAEVTMSNTQDIVNNFVALDTQNIYGNIKWTPKAKEPECTKKPRVKEFGQQPYLLEKALKEKCVLREENMAESSNENNFSISASLREFHGDYGLNCDFLPLHMVKTDDESYSVSDTTNATASEYATASLGTSLNPDAAIFQLNSTSLTNQTDETFITPDDDCGDAHSNILSSEYNCNEEVEEEECNPQLPNEEEDDEELRRVRLNAFIESVPSQGGVHVHPLYYKVSNQKGFEKYRLERQGTITQTSARIHHLNFGNDCFGFNPRPKK